MCACICIYMYVNVCVNIYVSGARCCRLLRSEILAVLALAICICMYVCIHKSMNVCIYVCVRVYAYTCMLMFVSIYMCLERVVAACFDQKFWPYLHWLYAYVCRSIYINVCTYVCVLCTYTCIRVVHVRVHIHKYTYKYMYI